MHALAVYPREHDVRVIDIAQPPPTGHQVLLRVLQIGEEVSTVRTGDLAVPTVRRPCADPGCRACQVGRQDFCTTGDFTDGIMKDIVLNNQAIVGTVDASRSAFALAVHKLEHDMYLIPSIVRAIITNCVPLDATPDTHRGPHGVKDIIRVRDMAA